MQLLVILFWFFLTDVPFTSLRTTTAATITNTSDIAKPGCQSHCGSVNISYPFGIGPDCFINPWFEIICNTSFNPPKPFYGTREIYDISGSTFRLSNTVASRCYDRYGNVVENVPAATNMGLGSPFRFSQLNKFTLIGCADLAAFVDDELTTGCLSLCSSLEDVVVANNGSCSGGGCCQTSVPKGRKFYLTTLLTRPDNQNRSMIWSFNPCAYSFMGEQERFTFHGASDLIDPNFKNRIKASVPLLMDWVIGNLSCSDARNTGSLACQENSFCVDSDTGVPGYRCVCNEGYQGSPYLVRGCQDIDECEDPNMNSCERICRNVPGNYTCSCPDGYYGDGRKKGSGCIAETSQFPVIKFSLGMGFGFLGILAGLTWLYFGIKKRKLVKLRQEMFQRNGGLLLQQRIMNSGSSIDSTLVFTADDLEIATNNYAKDMILGRGGFGTVYKGVLRDNRVVAIKKSKEMNESQVQQFINEVLILTQVNHRNVVKLLGCCLETKIPLLVYEYVSNGTLFDHIHSNQSLTWLSWDNRLRIASESATALSYLHSATAMPVIHRDIKCANILLDENYTPKIADFGASRLIPIDQKQVETMVQGTFGYLDPEYFNTGQLNKKSDVYSFGVVLAELLTSKKPVLKNGRSEEMILAKLFIMALDENRLFQILDRRVVREGTLEQLQEIAELVKRCLNLSGDDRPTMKTVVVKLEGLRKFTKHPWPIPHDTQNSITNTQSNQVDLYSYTM